MKDMKFKRINEVQQGQDQVSGMGQVIRLGHDIFYTLFLKMFNIT